MMGNDVDRRVKISKLTVQRRKVTVRFRGTIRSTRSDERYRRSPGFDDVGTHMSRRYGGASSCNALYVMTLILNCIRRSTESQCRSSRRIGVTCARMETPPNSLAAAFSTDCSRRMSHAGRQRVTIYSSPTGKLRMRAATNGGLRAIVNDEQHVVDEVER